MTLSDYYRHTAKRVYFDSDEGGKRSRHEKLDKSTREQDEM